MSIRTLIVDDEPLARERLRQFLSEEPQVEIVGECSDGHEALETIAATKPDLIFLDVQMPELDGFGVVAGLAQDPLPLIIFVTAYDEFALKAFEVRALDYLLKPFDRDRFRTALRRAMDQLQRAQPEDLSRRLSELLSELKPAGKTFDRLAIKVDNRVVLLKPDEIDWIESADNYVHVHAGKENYLHRETLSAMEARLPTRQFLRISRSTVVNLERIKELQPMFHGEYSVILRDGTRLSLSRGYRDKVNQLLGREGDK